MYRLGITTQWVSVIRIFRLYWRTYGGMPAFFTSPYMHVSLLLTILCSGYWRNNPWYDTSLSLVPGLLGFTLAAYTIILTIGNDQFREVLATILFPVGVDNKKSAELSQHPVTADSSSHSLLMVNSTIFLHVLVAQVLAVFSSLLAKQYHLISQQAEKVDGAIKNNWWTVAFHGFGYYYFIYSLLLILAACIAVFRLSQQIDKFLRNRPRTTDSTPPNM